MTLSKAEWRAVRPDRLRNLDAAKLMEGLRRRPGDTIEAWQDVLAACDELQRVLNRTPRMLGKAMPEAFRAALQVWYRDIDDLRGDGRRALDDLGHAYVDAACSAIARTLEAEVLPLVATADARIKAEKKRAAEDRDRSEHVRLMADLASLHETIRALRREKMKSRLRDDRMAQDLIRAKHVRMRKFKMTCDLVLKRLLKALADAQKAYDKVMGEATRPRRDTGP